MLKEIFSRKLKTTSKTVCNAIITIGDIDDSGKGRRFKSRFIQPGLAGYPGQFGNVLVKKETLDSSLKTIIGAPVIINHKNVTKENSDDLRVGVISNAWYNEKDGWYWCKGVIWDETAQNLITDKKWSVSCSYDYLEENDEGGTENNIPYDREFTKLNFVHLALVDNPRYERANIVFNSKTFKEEDHPRDEQGKFTRGNGRVNPNYKEELKQVIDKAKNSPNERQKLVIGKVTKDLEEKAKENGFDITDYEHDIDVSGTRHAMKEHGQPKTEEPRGQIPITDEDFERIPDVIYSYDEVHFTGKNKIGRETITYKKAFDDNTMLYVEEIRDKKKTLTINTLYKHKNTGNPRTFVDNNNPLSNASINIITDMPDGFNPDITKNKADNTKEQDMTLLEELKKLITKVENDKGENMDNNTIENEKVDKRKLIDEIGGILKGKVDDELIRTIIAKAEKLSYDKSTAGTSDNSEKQKKTDDKPAENVKNETEKDKEKVAELKKEVKEDTENNKPCANSVQNAKGGFFEKMNENYNSVTPASKQPEYVSQADRLKAAEEYFKA